MLISTGLKGFGSRLEAPIKVSRALYGLFVLRVKIWCRCLVRVEAFSTSFWSLQGTCLESPTRRTPSTILMPQGYLFRNSLAHSLGEASRSLYQRAAWLLPSTAPRQSKSSTTATSE